MISCLICFSSIENLSSDSAVCLSACGHCFCGSCIIRWCETSPTRSCPKCRCQIPETNGWIKLFFGSDKDSVVINNTVRKLLDENDECRNKVEYMMEEINKNMKIIDSNTKELVSLVKGKKRPAPDSEDNSSDRSNACVQMKKVVILLSRDDVKEYLDTMNH